MSDDRFEQGDLESNEDFWKRENSQRDQSRSRQAQLVVEAMTVGADAGVTRICRGCGKTLTSPWGWFCDYSCAAPMRKAEGIKAMNKLDRLHGLTAELRGSPSADRVKQITAELTRDHYSEHDAESLVALIRGAVKKSAEKKVKGDVLK